MQRPTRALMLALALRGGIGVAKDEMQAAEWGEKAKAAAEGTPRS